MTTSESTDCCELTVCTLASGSRGNAVYISDGRTGLLVDAGLSGVEIERRLAARNLCPKNIDAILVSHEHTDHIKGVGVLSRKYSLPVYMTPKTARAVGSKLGRIDEVRHFEPGVRFRVDRLTIHPFSLSHDAADPAGFTIGRNGTSIGLATDLGVATALVKAHLRACTLLILEANHDPDLLMHGPYPWHLKQRVKGRTGHLSNSQSRELLQEVIHEGMRHVILGHLSQQNNTPDHALREVALALNGHKTRISVALQDTCGELIRVQTPAEKAP
ncbi:MULTISPECIES: MBL fold metallo-hydrolase [Desulfococcus]|jgi:phosphoribosyl 1,2-cyclic phosphodiesterase|uniref:Beta-lactamase domain protein n=1 Tax=Desulfococcus multivorans DSM 2059 TaxID=1121405 RepID=S7TYQ8_DESML|nr:MBL fold metallo-hydrolase [Desulfococcus multivorans]AOY56845.1 beta-lactamase domain protein [Desulfococcus multivorans]AQU99388.1 MBL fold metallo-hydrolase [Desulfococcus multivorans]EPR41860.1 beta-lactamase domain protein [Desulfococcus multivorans DSM 2059]MDX9817926.1 MBL fold metallo-hydrolase [Desulfococcus multivorans]SJZ93196.1 Phosphoribosyl 1,2-cyclic phosphodiesterase [Desulfococcus multivorans DSM 2059]